MLFLISSLVKIPSSSLHLETIIKKITMFKIYNIQYRKYKNNKVLFVSIILYVYYNITIFLLILKQGENEPVLIFVAGQQVRAKFAGKGHFYPATISTVNEDGTFDLKYLDGDWEEGAKKENLLPL